MPENEDVFQAIRDSWSPETCGEPDNFSAENPSWQQCDASAFVAWEHLGGDLVLGRVFVNGEQTEHPYWNRIDGQEYDVTREQFSNGEEIVEASVVPSDYLRKNMDSMKPEVLQRIAAMREKVKVRLAA